VQSSYPSKNSVANLSCFRHFSGEPGILAAVIVDMFKCLFDLKQAHTLFRLAWFKAFSMAEASA
jgi:hypothetical protein